MPAGHRVKRVITTALTLAALLPATAGAATFTNATPIIFGGGPDDPGLPYPSAVNVTGMQGPITGVSVTLNSFSHDNPEDVGVVLVAPNGDAMLVQSRAGEIGILTDVTYSLADAGTTELPEPNWPAGTYRPAAYDALPSFAAPGPLMAYANPGPTAGGTATFAGVFNGDGANGTWNLFARDFAIGAIGEFGGGWSLNVTTQEPPGTPQPPPGTPQPPLDATAPETTITKAPKKKSTKKKATIAFASSEAGSSFQCKLKGKQVAKIRLRTFNPCTSPKRYKRLAPGKYKFFVFATDAAGNADPTPAKQEFRVVP